MGTEGERRSGTRRPRVRRGALPVAELAGRIRSSLASSDEQTAWRWLAQFADDYRGSSRRGRAWLVEEVAPLTAWTSDPSRFVEPWWFPAGLPALEAVMIRDSPISFKRHGVFVGANAFDRV